jgi:DNA primase
VNQTGLPITAAKQRHRLYNVARRTGIWVPATTGNITVRCPMPNHGHYDRTPSLRLHLDDDTWYCHACSHHAGDVIDWVQQTQTVGWRQAIDILDSHQPLTNTWNHPGHPASTRPADALGISERPDLLRTPTERVQQALDATWRHATTGPAHARATAYLARRGLNLPILEDHTGRTEAGHTPTTAPGLVRLLQADGFTPDELVDAGIAHRRPDSTLTDFYHDRVLIPIRDPDSHLAGLVGRNIGNPRSPKYKNPPRTLRYDKTINLYQPLPAPHDPDGRVIVVEGTLDALAIATAAVRAGQADRYCPVTQSGRELSDRQLSHILTLHPNPPVLAFDADSAGRESTRRLATRARLAGAITRAACMPEGEDPASWLASRGPSGLGTFGGMRLPGPQLCSLPSGPVSAPLASSSLELGGMS